MRYFPFTSCQILNHKYKIEFDSLKNLFNIYMPFYLILTQQIPQSLLGNLI
jgi:hypothetical protein